MNINAFSSKKTCSILFAVLAISYGCASSKAELIERNSIWENEATNGDIRATSMLCGVHSGPIQPRHIGVYDHEKGKYWCEKLVLMGDGSNAANLAILYSGETQYLRNSLTRVVDESRFKLTENKDDLITALAWSEVCKEFPFALEYNNTFFKIPDNFPSQKNCETIHSLIDKKLDLMSKAKSKAIFETILRPQMLSKLEQSHYTGEMKRKKQSKLDQFVETAGTAQLNKIMTGQVTDMESFQSSSIDSTMAGLAEVSGQDTSQLAAALRDNIERKKRKKAGLPNSSSSGGIAPLTRGAGGCQADLTGTWRAVSSSVNPKDSMLLTANSRSNFKAYNMGGGSLQTIGLFTYSTTNNAMTRNWISMKTGGTTSHPKPSTVPCSFDGATLKVGNISYKSSDNKQKQLAREQKQSQQPAISFSQPPTAIASSSQAPPTQPQVTQPTVSVELDSILQEHSDISAELGAGNVLIKNFCEKTSELMGRLYTVKSKAQNQKLTTKFNLYMQSVKAQQDNCDNPQWVAEQRER